MQKIGIIGGGETGQSHIESIRKIRSFEFAGIFDFDQKETNRLHKKYKLPAFNSIEDLIDQSDIVDITGSNLTHFEMASMALRKSRHVFIDRPLIGSISEANKLIDLAFEANVKVQIGHMERFKSAFKSASKYITHPNYIEAKRSCTYTKSNADKHVVFDLMIQDIDIILSVVDSGIKRIQAHGHSIDSKELLMVNAHIVFDNGCIANITSSKISQESSAQMHVFQNDNNILIDFLNDTAQYFDASQSKFLLRKKDNNNLLLNELESFHNSIQNNTTPDVTLLDGGNALELAIKILNHVEYWQDVYINETKFGSAK